MHDRHGILFDIFFISFCIYSSVHALLCATCFVCWSHPYVFHCCEPHSFNKIDNICLVYGGGWHIRCYKWRVATLLQNLLVDTRVMRWFWDAWEPKMQHWQKTYCLEYSRIRCFHINDFPLFPSPSQMLSEAFTAKWVIDTFERIFVLWLYCVLRTAHNITHHCILLCHYLCVVGFALFLYGRQLAFFFSYSYLSSTHTHTHRKNWISLIEMKCERLAAINVSDPFLLS